MSNPETTNRPSSMAVGLARELYDRFVMGGWQPADAHALIDEVLSPVTGPGPRDCIVGYLAALDQMRNQIDLEYGKMADALIDRLSDAGFLIMPRGDIK